MGEVAQLLRCSKATVYALVERGELSSRARLKPNPCEARRC
ncbi:MAG: helix-turn-helix domain-containing protein [Myxococcaceae bacterium]